MAFNFWSGKYLKQNARQTSQDRVKANRKKRTEPGTKYAEDSQERQELTAERRAEMQQQEKRRSLKRLLIGLIVILVFIVGIGTPIWLVTEARVAEKQSRYIHEQFEVWYANMKVVQQRHAARDKFVGLADSLFEAKEYRSAAMNYSTALKALPDDSVANFGQAKALAYLCRYKHRNCGEAKLKLDNFHDTFGWSEALGDLKKMVRGR